MEEYQIHDLSERQLKYGYWLLTHAKDFKKALIIVLIIISVAGWGIALYGLTAYLLGLKQDPEIIRGIIANEIDFAGFRERNQPADLQISQPELIYTGNNKYDFVAEVYNPNPARGVAALTYYFLAGDFSTSASTVSIWPNQRVLLLSLGNQTVKRLDNAALQITDLSWQSLTGASIVDTKAEPITVSQVEFTQGQSGKERSFVTFMARNNTFKNIWDVDFQAALYSNNNLVGVNQISTAEFLSETERQLEISWFESLPRVTKVEVIPVSNIYDADNFYELPGKAVEE